MRILFAANRFPYPPFRGDKLKIYNLAKRLCKKHELHLITFLQDDEDAQYVDELKTIFTKVFLVKLPRATSFINSAKALLTRKPLQVAYFSSADMAREIKEVLQNNRYDAVHVQHLRMAQYFENIQSVPRILDLPDAYSLYWKRRAEATTGLKHLFNALEQKRIDKYEHVLNKFDKTLVCSKEDQQWLQTEQNIKNVSILPNGVDTSTFHNEAHDYSINDVILFTGNMDYAPNIDAVQFFATQIFPELKENYPQLKFIIAGQRPVESVLSLKSKDIEVTGFVKDLKEVYKKASIVVAPLRFGAGTQNKVLEAMSMAVPVVSMDVGFKGLNIESGEGVVLASTTKSFASTCLRLLGDEKLRKEIGEQGKEVIMQHFDWDVVAEQLEKYLNEVKRA